MIAARSLRVSNIHNLAKVSKRGCEKFHPHPDSAWLHNDLGIFPGPYIRLPTSNELPRAAEDAATGAQLLGGIHEYQGEGARHRHGCDQTEAGNGAALLQGMISPLPLTYFNFQFHTCVFPHNNNRFFFTRQYF